MQRWGEPPEFVDVDVPEPSAGQVLVRVAGVGACHSDLSIMRTPAAGAGRASLPFTLGHETAGWVAAVGAGVRRVAVGDPVVVYISWGCGACARCIQGLDHWCPQRGALAGMGQDGGLAEYQLVPDDRYVVPLRGVDPRTAGPLADAGLTAYHAVRRALRFPHGAADVALVIGAGGLGHVAIQVLRALSGLTVIAVDTDETKRAHALAVGAHLAVTPEDAGAAVAEASADYGAQAVLDFVGVDATMSLAAKVAAAFGTVTIVGAGRGTLPLDFFTLPKDCDLSVSGMGSVAELHAVVALADRGALEVTTSSFPLADALDVYERLAQGAIVGRAVLHP